ncbi:MAG: hypothetical protein ABI480_16755, partial [Chitinophagaceae bacterium]
VALNPRHALSSLTLIHALTDLNEWHTGFKEIRRYMSADGSDKVEHVELIKELMTGIHNFSTSERHEIKRIFDEFCK